MVASASSTLTSLSPYDGSAVGETPVVRPQEVDQLVAGARSAQRAWEAQGPVRRAEILARVGHLLSSNRETLCTLVAREVGKPIREATAEVDRGALICAYYAGAAFDLGGIARRSSDPTVMVLSRQKALGVAGVITPWNFPVAIPAWKMLPALAAGCAVVWKPASASAVTAGAFIDLAREAGVPEDVLVLACGGSDVGEALVCADLDALSFTGSTTVGRRIRELVGNRSRPRLTLELGGVNVAHVLSDADLEVAAASIVDAAFGFAGQKCTASQVVAVHASVADVLIDELEGRIANLTVGDPLDPTVTVGPVIDDRAASSIRETVREIIGGRRTLCALAPDGDAFVSPTLILGESEHLTAHELFGPVATLVSTRSVEDHERLARASGLALSAAIYGTSADAIREMINVVGAGVVAVNRPSTGLEPHVPFGGLGESGSGFAEQGLEGLRFYLEWQTVYWKGRGERVEFP